MLDFVLNFNEHLFDDKISLKKIKHKIRSLFVCFFCDKKFWSIMPRNQIEYFTPDLSCVCKGKWITMKKHLVEIDLS